MSLPVKLRMGRSMLIVEPSWLPMVPNTSSDWLPEWTISRLTRTALLDSGDRPFILDVMPEASKSWTVSKEFSYVANGSTSVGVMVGVMAGVMVGACVGVISVGCGELMTAGVSFRGAAGLQAVQDTSKNNMARMGGVMLLANMFHLLRK